MADNRFPHPIARQTLTPDKQNWKNGKINSIGGPNTGLFPLNHNPIEGTMTQNKQIGRGGRV